VESVEALVERIADQRAHANQVRIDLERDVREAERLADEVAEATEDARRLAGEVAAQRAAHAKALEELKDDQEAVQGHLQGLEAESRRIERQLAELWRQQSGGSLSPGGWARPVGGRLTSPFGQRWGRMHRGVDLGGSVGTTIVAAKTGVVIHVTD